MNVDFWTERWQQNQIGFHLSATNPNLIKYWPAIADNKSPVFVPLCGKSLDLIWLMNQGHQVTGAECSAIATTDFFAENDLQYEKIKTENFSVYKHTALSVFQGDFFALKKTDLKNISYVFDRAALIALPEGMRKKYAAQLSSLLDSTTKILLITLEYDQTSMQGPPFSVTEDEVMSIYNADFHIEKLHQQDILDQENHFKSRGLTALIETVYTLQKR